MTWWRRLVNRSRLERELDAELRDHYERQVADYLAAGMSDADARRNARLALGGDDQIKEQCRDARGTRWVDNLVHDLRSAVRMLVKSPVFTSVAVLSLALGIGANTAMFSIVNSLLLRALPVREPDQLVVLDRGAWSNPIWEQIRDQHARLFDGAAAFSMDRFDLADGAEADHVAGLWVSGAFFDVLGVDPMLGRMLTPADDRGGIGPDGAAAVISYAFWHRRFGGAADVVGRRLTVNRTPATIVGVTPPEFFGPVIGQRFDVALPIGVVDAVTGDPLGRLEGRSTWWLEIMARLKPGYSPERASAELRRVQPEIRAATLPTDFPPHALEQYLRDPFTFKAAAGGPSHFGQQYAPPLLTMMAVVGLVLLIGCANLANLLLARTNERRHELAMRRALGASGVRLARYLLLESLLLGTAGAVLGLLFAQWTSQLLIGLFSTTDRPVFLDVRPDLWVLAFTMAVGLITALLFGVAPALRAARVDPTDALKEHGRGSVGGRRTLGGPLMVVQIALSLVLVVVAGLFVRTFTSLAQLDLGFDRDAVLLVNIDASRSTAPDRADLVERVRQAVASIPGVASAGASAIVPTSGMGWNNNVQLPAGATKKSDVAWFNAVTPGFFRAYGTQLLAGRDFDNRDTRASTPVAVVNEAFARAYFKNGSPIGLTLKYNPGPSPDGFTVSIVGIVEDAVYRSPREPKTPTLYLPMRQLPREAMWPWVGIGVRVNGGPAAMTARSIVTAVTSVDRDLSMTFRPLDEQVAATMATERVLALLAAFFGGLALLLAGIGLYGVTAYAVSLRRMEIGVRMALGADSRGVLRLVLGRVGRWVLMGVAIGGALSLWGSRFVASLLFGLDAHDPATLTTAAATLAFVSLVAAWLPARQALRIDPAGVLREG